ncbi:hypothetical protein L7F22_032002 [Adiantum nelumboides]|nr:hypothetical protein [Adiantum nelumboides]
MCSGDGEGQNPSCIAERSWNADANSWRMDNTSKFSTGNAHQPENASNRANVEGVKVDSHMVPDIVNDQSLCTRPSNVVDGRINMPPNHRNNSPPTSEEVRIDIHEQTSNLCNVIVPQHTNKLKFFRLSRSRSVGGSVFCFSMQRQSENEEKDCKGRAAGGSIKLTRIGSLPCNSKLRNEAEKGFKHTCRKPPRPPRLPLEKSSDSALSRRATSDTILVLHGTARRARADRRKRHSGASSSNASIWALIFTLLFALAMLGEGFWSQSSATMASNLRTSSTIDATTVSSDINPHSGVSTIRTKESGSHVSSQLEKEMQMREFWMSKGLDPT